MTPKPHNPARPPTRSRLLAPAAIAALSIFLGLGAGALARADAPAQLTGRVEEQLLSDGISLERLGQSITLTPEGTGIRVALIDRATGQPLASRMVDQLPADPTAAVAHLTVMVTEMLRERGLGPPRGPGDWAATFGAAAVIAHHRPASIAVVPAGRSRAESRAAADALAAAYRAAGVPRVDDARALGDVGDAEDPAIAVRAAALSVERVAVVRAFLDSTTARAVVTLYTSAGQLVAGFSATAGQPLAAPAARGAEGGVADKVLRERDAAPMPHKDGVVRLWIRSPDPQIQLLSSTFSPIAIDGAAGTLAVHNVLCRAPCGEVIDGSLGGEFYFGGKGLMSSRGFQLLSMKGDVTATVKPRGRGRWIAGNVVACLGTVAAALGTLGLLTSDGDRNASIAAVAGGAGLLGIGIPLILTSMTTYSFAPGRPR
jgi:hypothetical protein